MRKVKLLLIRLIMVVATFAIAATARATGRALRIETATTGKETKGHVLNAENEAPIDNAVVLVLWNIQYPTLHGTNIQCVHAASTQTDQDGYWQIQRESYWNRKFLGGDRHFIEMFVYKPGYQAPSARHGHVLSKGVIWAEDWPNRHYAVRLYNSDKWVKVEDLDAAKRAVGHGNAHLVPTPRPDLREVETLVNSSQCVAKDGTKKELLPFLRAIRADVAAHAKQKEELLFLERMDDYISELSGDVRKKVTPSPSYRMIKPDLHIEGAPASKRK